MLTTFLLLKICVFRNKWTYLSGTKMTNALKFLFNWPSFSELYYTEQGRQREPLSKTGTSLLQAWSPSSCLSIDIEVLKEDQQQHRLQPDHTHARTHTHTQSFYGPFSRTTRVSQCQKKSSFGLYGAREDNRDRHSDHPVGRHSIRSNQRPTTIIPNFYAGCPSCHNPPTLSWLGTGTKYAGLNTSGVVDSS